MKKRIEMLVKRTKILVGTFAAFLVLVLSVTGCTFSNGKKEVKTQTVAEVETEADENVTIIQEKQEIEIEEQTEEPKKTEKTLRTTPISASLEKKWEDVPVGAYCIVFWPDELCFHDVFVEGLNNPDSVEKLDGVDTQTMEELRGLNLQEGVYYIPDENKQKRIQKILNHSRKKKKISSEGEYSLLYKTDKEKYKRIGGTLHCEIDDEYENPHAHTRMFNPKLHKYLSKILKDEFQYEPLDVTTITDIESATLEYVHHKTKKQYSQTIKKKEILDKLENWFSNAKPCCTGDRPYFNGLLTLKLNNGKDITLTMASSGVPYFEVNGVLYEYDPKPKRKRSGYEFFECFDEIPYYNHYYNPNRVNATQKRKIKKLCKNFTKFLCRELVAEGTIIRLGAENAKTWKFQDWKTEDTTYKENMLASLKYMDCKNAAERVFDIKDWDVTPALEDYGNVRLSMSTKSIRKVSSKRYKATFHIEWENAEKNKKIRSATFTLKKKKGTYYGFVVKNLTMKKTAK